MQNKMCKYGDPNCRGCMTQSDHEERKDNFFAGVIFTIVLVAIFVLVIVRWVKVDKMMNSLPDNCYTLEGIDGNLSQICDGQ